MKNTLRLNLAWSLLIFAAFTYLAVGGYNDTRGALLIAASGYVGASIAALRGHRWAVGFTVIVSTLLSVRWLPMVVVNLWMFVSGHELYQDSPATIFIVVVYAVVFAIPSTVVCALFLFNRKELWFTLRTRARVADA